jgi:hypothetical protein
MQEYNSASTMEYVLFPYLRIICGASDESCRESRAFLCFSVAWLRHPQYNSQLCRGVIGHCFCIHLPVSKLMIMLLYVVKTLFLGPFTQQTWKATFSLPVYLSVFLSVWLSICLYAWNNSDPTEQILREILYRDSLLKPDGWMQISLKSNKADVHFA